MKNTSTKFLLLVLIAFSSLKMNAQTICMVTADFQTGENYMVMWEQFADVSLFDSIYIYRQEGTETVFSKIGAVDVTLTSPTYFVDSDANTMDTTKYAISYLYATGAESTLSYWHQPALLDYVDDVTGQILWTKYKKEDQLDESYILSYECFMDPNGIGNFGSASTMMNFEVTWFDQAHDTHPSCKYVVEVALPDCNVLTKSNINTSRSNIKNQQSNASVVAEEAGIQKLQATNYSISPNPASDRITITTENLVTGNVWISNLKGQELAIKLIDGKSIDFDVRALQAGVYFVNIENGGVVTSKKFIKK
jgi:hypothetical protein